jgi:hypothetical protein
VLLPRRWVVERSFAWATRCRRLVKDYERFASTLAGFHVIAFVGYMLKQAAELIIRCITPSRGNRDAMFFDEYVKRFGIRVMPDVTPVVSSSWS